MAYTGVSGVPTAEIVASFADGRLWLEADRPVEQGYKMSGYSTYGVPFRVGHVDHIEKITALGAYISGQLTPAGQSLAAPLEEARISGDTLLVVLRRNDIPQFLSGFLSGQTDTRAYGALSGITSGIGYMGELASGLTAISGFVSIKAQVIGY